MFPGYRQSVFLPDQYLWLTITLMALGQPIPPNWGSREDKSNPWKKAAYWRGNHHAFIGLLIKCKDFGLFQIFSDEIKKKKIKQNSLALCYNFILGKLIYSY